ncbi:MAG TPA: hypothetical protein VL049_13980 [Candidatus Dormibacteraeota bacterium]|nr:hypothetical protein [Candidatus Dormibacteraeota bacterium]
MSDTIDDAYTLLLERGPEYGLMGFANHAPMAIEAMVRLGRADAVAPWLARYAAHLGPQPAPRAAIEPREWSTALGDEARFADWRVLFDHELASGPWVPVLDIWAARLAPGLIGAALHGILRAAHATRALAESDTPARRRELAQGLAYWAATFYRLPNAGTASTTLPAADALRAVPFLPQYARHLDGSIVDALAPLADFAPFHSAIGLVDTGTPAPDALLSDITAALAGAYLANVRPATLIALIHFVTGPSAVRLLFPHVSDATRRRLLTYAWQAGAALYCVYGSAAAPAAPREAPPTREWLIDRAIASRDEHAIKFVEACLREDALRPSPMFRLAARDAVARLGAGS